MFDHCSATGVFEGLGKEGKKGDGRAKQTVTAELLSEHFFPFFFSFSFFLLSTHHLRPRLPTPSYPSHSFRYLKNSSLQLVSMTYQ